MHVSCSCLVAACNDKAGPGCFDMFLLAQEREAQGPGLLDPRPIPGGAALLSRITAGSRHVTPSACLLIGAHCRLKVEVMLTL